MGVWAGSGSQMRLGRRFGRLLGDFQSQDGSNLGPKKVPSWSQNGVKIDEKIDQKIDGFGNRFLKDFGKDFGTKIEVEIDVIFEMRVFEKTSFSHRKIHVFDINGVQVGSKNRSKIDQNLKSKMGCLLASIFDAFWSFFGGKLGGKIEPRSIKNRSKKASKK